jgi:hypothetical protein
MDQSGCKEVCHPDVWRIFPQLTSRQPFHFSEVTRFLSEKTRALWERIKQDKALELAQIEGLEVRHNS